MTLFEITQAERAGWQRRAACELAAILDAHPDLPVIAWTVASAGSILVGHVSGPASADQLRRTFDMWREMLLHTPAEEVRFSDGTVVVKVHEVPVAKRLLRGTPRRIPARGLLAHLNAARADCPQPAPHRARRRMHAGRGPAVPGALSRGQQGRTDDLDAVAAPGHTPHRQQHLGHRAAPAAGPVGSQRDQRTVAAADPPGARS